MPELPEVQTVLDTLACQMGNPVIEDIRIMWGNIIHGDSEQFVQSSKAVVSKDITD